MKFGALGWAHDHAELFVREMKALGHEFIGICEYDNPKIGKVTEKYNVPIISDEELLASADILCTTAINNQKIDIIEKCSELGKHIFVDKPLVVNLNDYKRLEKVINEGKIQVGFMLTERFDPAIYTLKKIIDSGDLGEIVSFTSFGPHKLGSSRPDWHFDEELCGGIINDVLVHHIDLFRWFTKSEVKEVQGYMSKSGSPEYPDFYDSANLMVLSENHIVGHLETDWWQPIAPDNYGDARVICVCTNGRATVKTADPAAGQDDWYVCLSTTAEKNTIPENIQLPHSLTEDFLKRIEGSKDVIISNDDILKSTYSTLIANQQVTRVKK